MSKLTYHKFNHNIPFYRIKFKDKDLGSLEMMEDGFYNWIPPQFNGSSLGSWVIKDISNKLEELNKEYQEHINKYFENENN